MSRPSPFEDRLDAFLDEGPSTGPVDLLATAHARARTVRQRPAWWLALKGDTMETTWRARPLAPGGLGSLLLILALVIVLAAAGLSFGSQLLRDRGPNALTLVAPSGPSQLLAFASYTADQGSGDLYVVRADGTDGRRLTADPLFDTSPVWSPDGSRIAFYSGGDGVLQLRVVDPDRHVRVLADMAGCMDGTNAPAWSPDGRFVLYQVDPDPADGACESARMDVHVVSIEGGASHRLLTEEQTLSTSNPQWVGDRIVMRGVADGLAQLLVATPTDPRQPWGLVAERIDAGYPDLVSYGYSQWSPDGTAIATTYIPGGAGFGTAMVIPAEGGTASALLRDPTRDAIEPAWAPDGTWLTVLSMRELVVDHLSYDLIVVGADGSEARLVATGDLSGNAGPVYVSPDGTLAVARAEIDDDATPGDLLIVDLGGTDPPVTVRARGWSSQSWQPLANPDNPAARAPEGLPEF